MKVTVNVECTPEEARTFMGLPDVQPLHNALLDELEQRMRANIQAMSPDGMIQNWLPAGLQGADQMQKMFWNQFQQVVAGLAGTTQALVSVRDPSKDS